MAQPTPANEFSEPFAIARQVFADLATVGAEAAADLVAEQVLTLLRCRRWSPELVVASITDHAGEPHVCVLPALPPGAEWLATLDMAGYRRRARQAMVEALEVDIATDDDGTPI